MKKLYSPPIAYRNMSEVAIFCKPIPLFLVMWAIMLASLRMRLTYDTYPDISVGLFLFSLSFASLIAGYVVARIIASYFVSLPKAEPAYQVDLSLLRQALAVLAVVVSAIVFANFIAYGPPPLFSILGVTALGYQEYGKLRQVMDAATMALTVGAGLEVSRWRRWTAYAFSFLCMTAYATRGFLLVMLAQALFAFCLRSNTKKRKLYVVAFGTLVLAVFLSDVIGNSRAESTLVAYFGITDRYAKWPMALLWVLSYISAPISNMCWIIHSYQYTRPSFTFLASMLPAFWQPEQLQPDYLGTPHTIDGVHTYLAKYYFDLWYFGIVLINFVWGLISAALTCRTRLVKHMLTSSVLLGAILFIFFVDYLTFFSIMLEFAILMMIERYSMIPSSKMKSSDVVQLAPACV